MLEGLRIISAFGERRMVGPPQHRRRFGVPPGGPFDRLSAGIVRALAGLPEEAPVLEVAIGPLTFEAEEAVSLVVVGGPDGVFPLAKGERIEIKPLGARAYAAVAELKAPCRLAHPPRPSGEPFRVVRGPQAALLDFDGFVAGRYCVGLASNRVGIRLEGTAMPHAFSLPSEPAIPGAIQIPPNGQPIVLGPDGPTIGGYPKVAVVIDADFDRLGRICPGTEVGFCLVTLEEAREVASQARAEQNLLLAELRVERSRRG